MLTTGPASDHLEFPGPESFSTIRGALYRTYEPALSPQCGRKKGKKEAPEMHSSVEGGMDPSLITRPLECVPRTPWRILPLASTAFKCIYLRRVTHISAVIFRSVVINNACETPVSEGTRVPSGVPNINECDSSALRVEVSLNQRSSLKRSTPESSAFRSKKGGCRVDPRAA